MEELTSDQQQHMLDSNYSCWRHTEGAGWIALSRLMFTWALCCHVDPTPPDGHFPYRYCYKEWTDALVAFDEWDGSEHPPGPWIKRKGVGGDLPHPDTPKMPWEAV